MFRKAVVSMAAAAVILATPVTVQPQPVQYTVVSQQIAVSVVPVPPDGKWDIALWGDSLIQGVGSTGQAGIRPRFTELASGINFEFTTTQSALGGWNVQDLAAQADGWLAQAPDIIFLMIGTNNAAGSCGTPPCPGMGGYQQAYRSLVDKILLSNPNLVLIVATVPYSNAPFSPQQVYVNQFAITDGSWNPLGAGRTGIAYQNHLHRCGFPDKVHPADLGWTYMAEKWYEALAPIVNWPVITFNHAKTVLRPGFETTATIDCR